jgi:hypothetical protein
MVDIRVLFSYFSARSQAVVGTIYRSFYSWYQAALQLCSPALLGLLAYLRIRSRLYRSLDPRKHEFRILTILSSEDHIPAVPPSQLRGGNDSSINAADIHCILQTASLDDEPSYTALSYVWGTDEPSTAVLINGKLVLVRKNLAAALRHLRQTDRSLNIWIDAICINQDDNEEKSHQVQMMGKIYKSCVEVLAWLGPADDESDTAMEKFESIGNKAIEAGIQDFRAADMANWFEPGGDERVCRIKVTLNELAVQEGRGLYHQSMIPFSKRDYWTRVWMVQEISLAPTVTIVCGSKRLSFTTFGAASNFVAFARWTLHTRSLSGSGHAPSAAPNVLIGARRRYHLETGEQESLRSVLQRTCILRPAGNPLKATDARDKIYGLRGLASDSEKLGIRVDYDKSTTEVYADVARAMIADGHTTILAWCQQPTGVEQFPSWVPDFSSHIREPCGEDHLAGPLFCASGSTALSQISISQGADRYLLRLLGTKIDTIAELGTAWEPLVDSPFNRAGAQQLLNEVETFCNRSLLLCTPEQASDAKMRIPCADQAGLGAARSRASSSIREEYELLRLPETYTSQRVVNQQYEVAMGFQHHRKPFLSAEGYVGLVPAVAEIGDIIIIIFGATVPFVVRELDGGKVQLIGEAFVYGIMDGEFLKVGRASETFCLC